MSWLAIILIKNLYAIGYTDGEIVDVYSMIDYMISLPDDLECFLGNNRRM